MKRLAVFLFASLMLGAAPAWAEKKVALVMGNADYQHATPLPNPTRDADAMTEMLARAGFTVISGTDLDRQGMADKIREFAAKAEGAETVLYFYAGHGIQLDGQNYLVPVDANLNAEMDVKFSALDIDMMLQQTPVTARVKLVLLDACRNNPFQEQIARSMGKTRSAALGKGLAEMKPTFGTLIAYATGPGEVALDGNGKNSPFTTALVKYLPERGLEIGQAMTRVRADVYAETGNQQLPWENKNLTSDYFLNPEEPVQVASLGDQPLSEESTAAPTTWTENNGEIVLWQAVKDSTDPTELQAYLDKYGDGGTFASSAKKRLAALEAKAEGSEAEEPSGEQAAATGFTPDPAIVTAEASSATETALGLGKTDQRILHIKLSALGFGSRSLGAEFNEESRRAIAKWQDARGYPVTGYLNRYQYDALLNDDAEEVATPEQELDEPGKPKSLKKKQVAKPAFKAEPKPLLRKRVAKPIFKAEPKPVKKQAVRKRVKQAPVFVERPVRVKRPRRVVEFDSPPPRKRRRGPVPKISISIGNGGGIGFGFGF